MDSSFSGYDVRTIKGRETGQDAAVVWKTTPTLAKVHHHPLKDVPDRRNGEKERKRVKSKMKFAGRNISWGAGWWRKTRDWWVVWVVMALPFKLTRGEGGRNNFLFSVLLPTLPYYRYTYIRGDEAVSALVQIIWLREYLLIRSLLRRAEKWHSYRRSWQYQTTDDTGRHFPRRRVRRRTYQASDPSVSEWKKKVPVISDIFFFYKRKSSSFLRVCVRVCVFSVRICKCDEIWCYSKSAKE